MLNTKEKNIFHDLFLVGIILKGIDGTLELIGGLLLFSIKTSTITTFVQKIFQHELVQDPTDLVANYLVHAAQTLSISTLSFASVYLMLHGAIKIGLFWGLWKKKLWAYPLAGVVLSLFVIYQFIRIYNYHSIVLLLLTMLDVLIITLLHFEYKRLKSSDV